MSGFRFSLEKALELRRLQLQLAEAGFGRQAAALLQLDRRRDALVASRADAEALVRAGATSGGMSVGVALRGFDLAALGAFRLHVRAKEKELAQLRIEGARELEKCRTSLLEARRRCRLMEKLKERRRTAWDAALNRAVEQVAAESYLARWNRGQA